MRPILSRLFYALYKWLSLSPKKTAFHPDYHKLIHFAFSFESDGQKYDFYHFREASDMPTARYVKYSEVLEDYQRKITSEELLEILNFMKSEMDKNTISGNTNTRKALDFAIERATIALDTDMFFKFISSAYFTKDEDLLNYDEATAEWKIDLFRKEGLQAFFLKMPLQTFLPQTSLSTGDFMQLAKSKKNLKHFWENLKSKATNTKEAGSVTGQTRTGAF